MLEDDPEPTPFDVAALQALETALSSPDGMEIGAFLAAYDDHFARPRSQTDVQAYREGKKPWKKLADEVTPVANYLRQSNITGRIRFPLDDQPPDAWLVETGSPDVVGIEVTRVLARPKVELAKRLRDEAMAPGFLGLADDATQAAYENAKARSRVTNSRQSIEHAIEASIAKRLDSKSDPKFAGHMLVLVTPVGSVPDHDWEPMKARLHDQAAATAFDRIILVDDARSLQPVQLFDRMGQGAESGSTKV